MLNSAQPQAKNLDIAQGFPFPDLDHTNDRKVLHLRTTPWPPTTKVQRFGRTVKKENC